MLLRGTFKLFACSLIITVVHKKTLLSCFLLILLFAAYIPCADSKIFFLEAELYQDKTQEKKIILGKGEVISSDQTIVRAAVSDPSICDLQVLGGKQIFVRAKQLGICTILVWEKDNTIPSRFDVEVWPDIEYLTEQLKELDKEIFVDYLPPMNSVSSGGSQTQGVSIPQTGGTAGAGAVLDASAGGTSGTSGGQSGSSQATSGRIILKGTVANAEIIARALQIAGAYIGDRGIKIISQPGGQIVDGLSGNYEIDTNTDTQSEQTSQGSATSFGVRDPVRFTTNRYANLSRGVIATTQNGSVISFLKVRSLAQISVAIKFYEISRNLIRSLGLNGTIGGSTVQGGSFIGGSVISQAIGGISSIANLMSFMAGSGDAAAEFSLGHGSIAGGSFLAQAIGEGVTGVIFNPDNGIGAIIQALQERGEIKTLAEPTLVITNGEPATFLAGGEVPIVRSVFTTGGASQDVTYEPFGIRFAILPTITGEDKIYLQLSPEIRDIDRDLSSLVAPTGSTAIRPPAFRTRRTQTQVELFSGQALAISGLLREDNVRNLRKVPGIGDIPILGTLFRSKSFRKGETELLVVVSPKVVAPLNPNEIAELKGTKDVPYNYFNQFTPLKPRFELRDEEGPKQTEPIDAGRYNTPSVIKKSQVPDNIQNTTNQKVSKVQQVQTTEIKEKKKQIKLNLKEQKLKKMFEEEARKFEEAKETMRLAREEERKTSSH